MAMNRWAPRKEGGQHHRRPAQAAFPGMGGPGLYAGHDNNDEGQGQRPGEQCLAGVEHSSLGLLAAIGAVPQPIPQPPTVVPVEAEEPARRPEQRPVITEHEGGRDTDSDKGDRAGVQPHDGAGTAVIALHEPGQHRVVLCSLPSSPRSSVWCFRTERGLAEEAVT